MEMYTEEPNAACYNLPSRGENLTLPYHRFASLLQMPERAATIALLNPHTGGLSRGSKSSSHRTEHVSCGFVPGNERRRRRPSGDGWQATSSTGSLRSHPEACLGNDGNFGGTFPFPEMTHMIGLALVLEWVWRLS